MADSSLSNGAGVAMPAAQVRCSWGAVRALGSVLGGLGAGQSPQLGQRSLRCKFFPSGAVPCPPIQVRDILVPFVNLWSTSGGLAELGSILDVLQLPSLTL